MLILLKRDITEVSAYLGQADVSITITMRMYAHFLKRKNQDTMSDLERLIHTARGENHEQLPEGEDLVKWRQKLGLSFHESALGGRGGS
jgi:hypothetical protein